MSWKIRSSPRLALKFSAVSRIMETLFQFSII